MNADLANESNHKIYEILFNILPYVFYKNISGVYVTVNTNQAKAFGFQQPSELIGKTIFEILEDKETAKLIDQVDNEVMQKGTTLVLEETINTPYGIKIFLTQKSPHYNEEGHITGMLGFATDITEFKEKQKRTDLELANQSLKVEHQKNLITLAHTVAHDISSPLSALNMMMHACDELKESKRIVIKRATESILDIANNCCALTGMKNNGRLQILKNANQF